LALWLAYNLRTKIEQIQLGDVRRFIVKSKYWLLGLCIIITLTTGGTAWGQCVDDVHDDALTAFPIGYNDTVSDVVCTDIDPFDYYVFEIPQDAEVSGTITFESQQTGTVLKLTGPGGVLYNHGTTDTEHTLVYNIPTGPVAAGSYYARVSFWSAYAYDHEYTLTLDLTVTTSEESETPVIQEVIREPISPELQVGPGVRMKAVAPWPSRRADAARRGRSRLNGPPGLAHKSAEFNLIDRTTPDIYYLKKVKGLLTGLMDRVYYINSESNMLVAFDLASGQLWEHPISHISQFLCIDDLFGTFVINEDRHRLYNLDYNGNITWTEYISGHLKEAVLNEIWAVGLKVYVSCCIEGGNYVFAWGRFGNLIWDAGPFPSIVVGIAEDIEGYTYIQTRTGLYQLDVSGNSMWQVDFKEPAEKWAYGEDLGPIIGHDGRVWVNDPFNREFYIYNRDGTLYKLGSYDHLRPYYNPPTAACVGGDGRFYVAVFQDIVCFDDWTNEVWRTTIGYDRSIQDMIMGEDDTIYVLYIHMPQDGSDGVSYFHKWISLNPANGNTITELDIGVPEEYEGGGGELAIGEDGKLLYLNHKGYLAVFSPGLPIVTPGLIREVPKSRRLEER
jgi:hypothetical protein